MKRIVLLFWSFLILKAGAFAEVVQSSGHQAVPPEPTIKPIKVSELNANFFSAIYDFFRELKQTFLEGFVSLKDFVETGEWFLAELKTPEMRELMGSFGIRLAISLILAFVIAQLVMLWIKPKINYLLLNKDYSNSKKYIEIIQSTLLSIIIPLIFGFLLYTIFRILSPKDGVYLETVRILSSGSAIVWAILNIAHVFLRPLTAEHQHIPLSRETLNKLYVWIRRMACVGLLGFFALETGRLIHLPHAGERLLLQSSSIVIAIMAIFMMLSLHKNLKDWIQTQRVSFERSRLKRSLIPYLEYSYIPLIILIVISYVSWVTHEFDRVQLIVWKCLLTLALFPFLQVAAYCVKKLRILYIHRNLKRLSPAFARRAVFYGRQIDFMMIALLYIIVFIMVLDLWEFDPYSFTCSKIGKLIFEKTFSIFTIIVVALFLNRGGMGLLNKYLNSENVIQNETHKQKMARFKTIHSVSRNVLRIAIWTPAVLFIIVEMDIDIIPILAPLTLLGAALAFGVQSIVKDFFSGFFMLLEDAFAVGDLVIINGQMGRIESLTVRVVRLRATDGSLFTFPYGNITSLCNQNRDFSAAVMLFEVGVEADMNKVYELLEKISKDLRKDPKTRSLVVDSVQIDGINEVSDHALQIRAVIKTKPSMHYKVKWAFNLLLKQYLEAYGIPAPTPRQKAFNYVVEK
ncbi:MAG: mechanosensitive ion channel [Alphaproteobacteria bacterium]|nr:mechanosensitive ion channel [Alphaproteobacteria bacterium]